MGSLELACAFGNRMRDKGVVVDGWDAVQWAIEFLGIERGFFGVESVALDDSDYSGRSIEYLNSGDTYDLTICREDGGAFFLSSWGDWIEQAEADRLEEDGEVRCGYCGAFTECAEEWRDTVCGACGHNVAGD